MLWKARILRLIPTISVGATLALGAGSAVCKSLQSDPVAPPLLGSMLSSNRGDGLRRAVALASVEQAARPDECSRPRRAIPPITRSRLKRTHYVAPEYPTRALKGGVSGFVTLEFVVNADGEPSDLSIIDAQPEGLFERAALTAVKRWRYQPLKINCAPTEIPTRQVIQFELTGKAR